MYILLFEALKHKSKGLYKYKMYRSQFDSDGFWLSHQTYIHVHPDARKHLTDTQATVSSTLSDVCLYIADKAYKELATHDTGVWDLEDLKTNKSSRASSQNKFNVSCERRHVIHVGSQLELKNFLFPNLSHVYFYPWITM